MPRPNPRREVFAEEYLAQRIQLERERRDMSYEGLAKRMTEAGCPINQSALYKVEQGEPRRRITVDELVALSRVFDVPVGHLLTDPKLLEDERVVSLLTEWRRINWRRSEVIQEADRNLMRIQDELRAIASESPEAAGTIRDYWEALAEDEPDDGLGARLASKFLPEGGAD